jgi:hypothetical protein
MKRQTGLQLDKAKDSLLLVIECSNVRHKLGRMSCLRIVHTKRLTKCSPGGRDNCGEGSADT